MAGEWNFLKWKSKQHAKLSSWFSQSMSLILFSPIRIHCVKWTVRPNILKETPEVNMNKLKIKNKNKLKKRKENTGCRK